MQLNISDGQDKSKVIRETNVVLENGWKLDDEATGIKKTFYFKTFTKALDFVNVVGVRCKSKNHHPVITLQSGSVDVYWTTHHPRGLSDKDTFMASHCDESAKEIGTVDESEAQKCRPTTSTS